MRKKNGGLLLALPALAGFVIFYFLPFLITLWYSVSFGIGQREFVGMANFEELLGNEMFLLAMKNTFRFLLVSVPVILAGSLGLAVMLQRITRGVHFLRLAYFYPMVLPIASVIMGMQMLWGETGVINVMRSFLGREGKDWFHSSAAFFVLCILYWWKYMGYHVLIFYARLKMIPKNYYENANLFGAGKWACFWDITLPLIRPVILFQLLLAVMNSFKCYKEAFLIGGNYPDESIYLLQHFMNNNFQNLNYQKISSAAVVMMTVVLLSAGLAGGIYWFVTRRERHG
ncbi:sugar ABC transporter permease [Roseburia hominis]